MLKAYFGRNAHQRLAVKVSAGITSAASSVASSGVNQPVEISAANKMVLTAKALLETSKKRCMVALRLPGSPKVQ